MLACALLRGGCAGSTRCLPPVDGFSVERYGGLWYEIARFPHRFERGLVAVTARYTARENGRVLVENRGFDPRRKKWRSATGRAYVKGDGGTGLLRVSFFWPFYGTYKVILLDKEQYGHAVVTSGTYDYLWILCRTPRMDEKTLAMLLEFVRVCGFDVSRLEYPDQAMNMDLQAGGPDAGLTGPARLV